MTKDEQILGFFKHTLGGHTRDEMFAIGQSLSVSFEDVLDYIRKNGFPSGYLRSESSKADGFYCVKQSAGVYKGKYAIYAQERACPYDVKIVDDYNQALEYIVREATGYYLQRDFNPDWTNDATVIRNLK